MSRQYIQPPELFESAPLGFTQVVKAPAGATLYLSGQGAFDRKFQLIGGDDVSAQTRQALANVASALAAASAGIGDLTSLRIYVVDYSPRAAMAIGGCLRAFFDGAPLPAQTLVGVQALGVPGMRVEIEAMAVVGG